jgi:cell division protease FtsH
VIAMTTAGRIAEEFYTEDISTGASNDIKQMTRMARKMVCEWGESERLGMVEYGEHEDYVFLGREMSRAREYSEATAQDIDREVRSIVDEAYARAKGIIIQHRAKIEKIAKGLLEYETLDASHIKEIMDFGEIRNPPKIESAPPPLPPPPTTASPNAPESSGADLPDGGFPAPAPA